MKTNAAALETALEARCSSSVPRIWYSYARTNILTTESRATSFESATDSAGWVVANSATISAGETAKKKYGDASMKVICPGNGDGAYWTLTSAAYKGKTVTASIRVYADTATAVNLTIGELGTGGYTYAYGATSNTTSGAWRVFQVPKTLTASTTAVWCTFAASNPAATTTFYLDGAKLEEASTASNWSSRFFDVDDIKSDGVTINATEIAQARLRGKLEWGQVPDNSAPAPLMAFTSYLKFTFEDDGTILSQWTKQGTGIHLRIGQTTSSAYADCTPAFHGIVWDWTKVAGTDYTYDVECYGLEKLWQEYDVGPDTVDGPRKWGQWLQTDTTVAEQFVYKLKHAVNGTASPYALYKATYDSVEVNRMNAQVCKWNFATTTEATYYLHALWPLSAGKTLVSQFYEGQNYTDWIDYVESLTAITNGMPASRTGHAGDTLTATDGPWAAVVDGTNAWDNLANAVGVGYYGFRYDENGQIVLKNLPGVRSVDATSRATSESDATKTGQIRAFERLDDVYRCNDPCVDFVKYGVASTTASTHPVAGSHVSTAQVIYIYPSSTTTYSRLQVTLNHNHQPFCPQSDYGYREHSPFTTTVIDAYPHTIDSWWRANGGDGSGTVTCSGGAVTLVAAAHSDTSFIESPTALGTTWCKLIHFSISTITDNMYVYVRSAQGAHADGDDHFKIGMSTSGGKLYIARRKPDGTIQYYQEVAAGGPGDTMASWTSTVADVGSIASDTSFYVALMRDQDSKYRVRLMNANKVIDSTRCRDASSAVASVTAGDDYVIVGKYINDNFHLTSGAVTEARSYDRCRHGPFGLYPGADNMCGPSIGADAYAGVVQHPFASQTPVNYQPLPQSSIMQVYLGGETAAAALIDMSVYGSPYCPEVHTVKVADAATTGIDGATTVAVSRAAYGYKGLKGGTWYNPFLWSDAQAQTLTNAIAKLNLEPRDVIRFATKHNPKYEPWDLLHVTYFSEYSAAHWEVIGIENRMNLDERGGGAETILTLRRWTA